MKSPVNVGTQLGSQRDYEDAQNLEAPTSGLEAGGHGAGLGFRAPRGRLLSQIHEKKHEEDDQHERKYGRLDQMALTHAEPRSSCFSVAPSFSDTRIEYNQVTDNIILVSGVLFQ
jgi:hypothetical protein